MELVERDGPQQAREHDDDRQDLLIFKIELPTTAELVFGLVRSFDIEIRALGYPTQEDGTFATRARWICRKRVAPPRVWGPASIELDTIWR